MRRPTNDQPLAVLKEKFILIKGELFEILRMDDQVAYFKPNSFIRGEYLCLYVSKNRFMAYHRVVWMLHHDVQIPSDSAGNVYVIDHFDTNKMNNATWNLRLVTDMENRHNVSPKDLLFPA